MPPLPTHSLRLALLQPQIAPNTGNIARLCVATGTALHLVRPLGFVLSDRNLKRSAMDYWPRLKLTVHDDTAAFLGSTPPDTLWLFSSKGTTNFWEANYNDGDTLAFGSETSGLPEALLNQFPTRTLRIPQAADERCLNLSSAAANALYEALRQLSLPG